MCEVSERIYREGIEEGKAKGRAEGRALIVILLCQNDLVAWHLSILLYRFLKEYNRIVYIVKVLILKGCTTRTNLHIFGDSPSLCVFF